MRGGLILFQNRPMPPMNTRGFYPPQPRQMPIMRQPALPIMRGGQFAPQAAARGGGLKGILSRIIPGNQAVGPVNPQGLIQGVTTATRSGAPGILQGLTNPSNISSMLGNVQKVLGMAQQVTPMVQQYGPLIKNLPAMIKIYRELNSEDTSTEANNENEIEIENENGNSNNSNETIQSSDTKHSEVQQQKSDRVKSKKTTKKQSPLNEEKESESSPVRKKATSQPKSSKPKMYI